LESSSKKRKFLTFFLLFLFFGLLFPLSPAQAQFPWEVILGPLAAGPMIFSKLAGVSGGEIAIYIAQAIASIFLFLIGNLGAAILALGIKVLSWAIGLVNYVPYTDPTRNPIIGIGWTLVRDVANIGFILGLIWIGLATAIGWAGFQTKKAFVWLLVMALLINFTPLICGIVVDLANLLTNFFLEGMTQWETLNTVYGNQWDALKASLGSLDWEPLARLAILVVFGFVAGFTLLLYAALLAVRIIAIWILVILSPLAFVAYIFTTTRKWFYTWWNQLLQWAFIGAIGGFFLYLSHLALWAVHNDPELKKIPSLPGQPLGTTFNAVAADSLALVFLIIGLYVTFQTSAMFADRIVAFARTKGKAAVKWGARKIPSEAAVTAAAAARGVKEGKGVWGKVKGAAKGMFTPVGREKGRESLEKTLERMHVVRPGFYEARRRERLKIDEEAKRLDKLPTSRLKEIATRIALTSRERAAKMAAIELLGKRHRFKLDTPQQERKAIQDALIFGANLSDLADGRPDLAPIINSSKLASKIEDLMEQGIRPQDAQFIASRAVIRETVEGMSPRQFTQRVQPEAMTPEVLTAMDEKQLRYLGTRGTEEQRKTLYNLARTPQGCQQLQALANRLAQQRRTKEWQRLINNWSEVLRNPNFRL